MGELYTCRFQAASDKRHAASIVFNKITGQFLSSYFSAKGELSRPSIMNIKKQIEKMPSGLLNVIRAVAVAADKNRINAYLVGGVVRDLLLNREVFDLDFVVESDAVPFAGYLRENIRGALVTHKRFGTASIVKEWPKKLGKCPNFDGKFKIDIATARKERYGHPAVLPDVEFSDLRDDLYRRDFTINAMALSINTSSFGKLIDPYEGIKDLKKGRIRVLHKKSLVDDPTRIFRAVRFEQRFNFKIDSETEKLIRSAVKENMFGRTEKQRIRNELILIFREKYPEKILKRMRALHELRFIHSKADIGRDINNIYRNLRKVLEWYDRTDRAEGVPEKWILSFMPVLTGLNPGEVRDVSDGFRFSRKESGILDDFIRNYKNIIKTLSSGRQLSPGEIFDLLKKRRVETILFCMAKSSSKNVINRIRSFLLEYSKTAVKISGDDLNSLGFAPGPRHRTILNAVLHAKMEKEIVTKKEEIDFVLKKFKKYRISG